MPCAIATLATEAPGASHSAYYLRLELIAVAPPSHYLVACHRVHLKFFVDTILHGRDGSIQDGLAGRILREWRDGGEPTGLPRVEAPPAPVAPRDVFLFFISADKEKAPAAAMALLERLRA